MLKALIPIAQGQQRATLGCCKVKMKHAVSMRLSRAKIIPLPISKAVSSHRNP